MSDLETEPTVACVVLNWHDVPRTVACVSRLLEVANLTSIWVVDNESDGDLVPELAELGSPLVQSVTSPVNLGFSAGMNLGLVHAARQADLVLCVNNDLLISGGDVAGLSAALMADPTLDMVAPEIENADGSIVRGGEFRPWTFGTREGADVCEPDFLTWACVMLRADALHRLGLLDERFFMYWEDVEFALRVRRAGRRFRTVPESRAFHELSASHERAAGWVDCYSTYGVVALGRLIGGRARAGSWVRVLARVGKSVARRDGRRTRFHLLGVRLALSAAARRGRPAHEVVASYRGRELRHD
ncbi:glycosyltransferase family 2 protein [Nocardioides dongkuii]|uniref:glycosyltransferase family 2 protein n=1 Tax=Nocardioides dongkuii TaxID=2760089 RepID=UPI0015FB7077|nr:glycosyltransferase family 2 protein [Nocardioides dongkuii]